MAYVQSPLPQDQQNQLGPTGTTTPNPLAGVPPQTGGSAGTGGGGGAPGVGSPTQFGSSASKLSDYLTANKDQIQGMGNQIAGTLGSGFNQTQGDINSASQGFQGQVNAGYAAPNSDLVKQAASDPTGFAAKPENVTAFQGQLNDQYTGPNNFESTAPYAKVQNEVQNAVQNASLINSPSGLSTYLGNNVEKNATPGQNTLDTALLESEPTANKAITDAAAPYAGLSTYLGNQTAAGDAAVAQAQTSAQGASQAAQNAFTGTGGVVPKFTDTLNQELAAANAGYGNNQALLGAENTAIAKNNLSSLTPDQLAAIGLSPDKVGKFQNAYSAQQANGMNLTPLSSYFSPGNVGTAPTMGNVASADQYGEAAALNSLLGQTNIPLDQSTAGEAGTYNPTGTASKFDLASAEKPLSNNDLDYLLFNGGNPNGGAKIGGGLGDSLNHAWDVTQNPALASKFPGLTNQSAAQDALNYLSKWGPSGNQADTNNPAWMQALNRLASNSYGG